MKLAITADWLVTFGGAEHMLLECTHVWPNSPIFTTVTNQKKLGPLGRADIRPSRLQFLHSILGKHQLLLPLMPRTMEEIDLRGYDVILSSSHAVGKGIVPPPGALHICYCHTPMRYAWEMQEEYLQDFRVPRILRGTLRTQLSKLRRWDLTTAKRTDLFIANSTETQERIKRIYGRDSVVIPPPVDEKFLHTPLLPMSERKSYIAIGRLVPYKRFDLLIELANREQLPLVIAGTGQEEKRLKAMAGPTVTFLGFLPDEEVPELYAKAKALLFPPLEDAGIVPLEAQAAGTPVIAFNRGGVRDTVREGITGVFFSEQTVDSLRGAIHRFEAMAFDPQAIREHAAQFSSAKFRDAMKKFVEKAYAEKLGSKKVM